MRCDIIIPVWNQYEITRGCLQSLLANTVYPCRLIIIDNGSDAQTVDYLARLAQLESDSGQAEDDNGDADASRRNNALFCESGVEVKKTIVVAENIPHFFGVREIKLIRNETNLGFIRAVNQGMKIAKSPFVCLLNNDTILTKGWLTEMIGVACSRPEIGVVNPSSNTLGQRPAKGQSVTEYANTLERFKGQWSELGACTGFCMLIKREVIEKIGYFDESFGMGNFEDTDFCRRAQQAGYLCVRAKAAYVQHREKASFKKVKGWEADFKRNQELFHQRWGRPQRLLYVLNKTPDVYGSPFSQALLKQAREGHWVWVFCRYSVGRNAIPEHSNLVLFKLPVRFFCMASLFRILKRKKRFDRIETDNLCLNFILRRMRFPVRLMVNIFKNNI